METNRFYILLFGAAALSAVCGVFLGYFFFGPMGVFASENAERAYVNYDLPVFEAVQSEFFAAEKDWPPEVYYEFIVTTDGEFIVVYYAAGENAGQVMEVTPIVVNAFPAEERERLERGIGIYTEEALFRILEDYGS
jgi:hypothetical protein